jgi:hypothetical protein
MPNTKQPDKWKPIEDVMREMDTASSVAKEEIVRRIRESMRIAGNDLTAQDEELLVEFVAGRITSEDLAQNFASRM